MKYDANANTLISEIMSNTTSAVMLFAPLGSGKADFLTELASRYHRVYWFSPVDCEMSLFIYYLVEKIIKADNPERAKKLLQLMYCRSEFNDESVVITAVLDYIANIRGNCIMIFEHMDMLPKNFKLSMIERIIKHCPNNLKVVVSSDDYVNFDFTKFEPQYPKLIDEDMLADRSSKMPPSDYIGDLKPVNKAFLTYISEVGSVDIDFVRDIYPDGVSLLLALSRHGLYVSIRDKERIHLNQEFTSYLRSIKGEYATICSNMFKEPFQLALGRYKLAKKQYFTAARIFAHLNDGENCDATVKKLLRDEDSIYMAADFACVNPSIVKYPQFDLPYWTLMYSVACEVRNDYAMALDICDKLITVFQRQEDIIGEMITLGRKIQIACKISGTASEYRSDILEAYSRIAPDQVKLRSLIFRGILDCQRELGLSILQIDDMLLSMMNEDCFQYIKNMESAAYTYFNRGNYKKALEITAAIKKYLPYYVIPHKFIAFKYYAGEVDIAEQMVSEALTFAQENKITEDISLLYCTMATIDVYRGRLNEAFQRYDLAVTLDKTDNYAKFFNITKRCAAYTRFKDPNYSKEISHIYLKYCRAFAPEYEHMILPSLAFAYHKIGDNEKARQYAIRCVQISPAHTTYWLICMAMITCNMMRKGDLKDVESLVRNILCSSYNYGMDMIVVEYYDDCFEPLINYARMRNIESEYIDRIATILESKNNISWSGKTLKVTMFASAVTLSAAGKDLTWRTKKAKDLFLHYLMAGSAGLDRRVILDFFWKDYTYASAINNLKTTNNVIRKTLARSQINSTLKYSNGKYILHIKYLESDYSAFCALRERYNDDIPVAKRMQLLNEMIKIYKGDFAEDVRSKYFNYERKNLKQTFVTAVIKLIRHLARQGEYMEAKHYLNHVILIDDENDYTHMMQELDGQIQLSK
ncbi:MAG: hypothetical protein LBE09_00300 [Christensenellaceae bacterium]|jgi:two-component SAPR family response regulator|nr:hypothetical protein [Christensenellaceae bacterium]